MTPRELIGGALTDAGRAQPDVQAAALLHAARVVKEWDRDEAIRLLDRGIDLARTLDEPDRQVMLQQALDLSGTVSPPRTFELASSLPNDETDSRLHKALYDMLEYGDTTAAVDYLVGDGLSLDDYPLDPAMRAMWKGKDDATRSQLLRRIASALLHPASWERVRHRSLGEFCRHFTTWSGLLPRDEAVSIVGQLVDRVLSEPDGRINARFNDVRFSSTREHRLFELLGLLRQFDPARADLLIRDYSQLAAAAALYPDGHVMRAAVGSGPRPVPAQPPMKQEPVMLVGQRVVPLAELAKTDFREVFDRALHVYAADSDVLRPNDAPMDVRPSTQEFRSILFHIGRHEGQAAARHLDRIPDATVRLLAQIELAAALAGLPEFGGRSMSPGPLGFREGWKRRAKERARGPMPGPSIASRQRPPLSKPNLVPSYDLHVVRAPAGSDAQPAGGSERDYLTLDSVRLRPLLARLYEISETRIDLQPSVDGSRYTLSLVLPAPESPARLRHLLREGLEKHFGIARDTRRLSVRVLTAPNGLRARKAIDGGMFGFASMSAGIGATSTGGITTASEIPPHLTDGFALAQILDAYLIDEESSSSEMGMRQQSRMFRLFGAPSQTNVSGIHGDLTMADLCATLEPGLGQPIIDDTHLDDRYSISLETTERTTAGFLEVLCRQLGLVADITERDVEMLVVR